MTTTATARRVMKCTLKFGGRKKATFTRGKKKVYINRERGQCAGTYSTRSGKVKMADGTIHDAILELCDSDSGEHNGTGIWTDTDLVFQDDPKFLEKLGKTKEQVFPYIYKYDGTMERDHHTGDDGWSR